MERETIVILPDWKLAVLLAGIVAGRGAIHPRPFLLRRHLSKAEYAARGVLYGLGRGHRLASGARGEVSVHERLDRVGKARGLLLGRRKGAGAFLDEVDDDRRGVLV